MIRFLKCAVFIFIVISTVGLYIRTYLPVRVTSDVEKCPFCYGLSHCTDFRDIRLTNCLSNIISTKNVYIGTYNETEVIIKKLASNNELHEFDQEVAHLFGASVHNNFSVHKNPSINEAIISLVQSSYNFTLKLRLCPGIQHLNLVLNHYFEEVPDTYNVSEIDESLINIWSILRLNPEPLLFKLFRSEDGWPTPIYFGSCGRIAVFQYCGEMLYTYASSSWLLRIHLAQKLLQMAQNFTFSHNDFALYLLDLTADNVAVDSNLNVYLVDMEHTILVDKNVSPEDRPISWFTVHNSEHFECTRCFMYSPSEICSHHISDHNFYAVCKEFLTKSAPQFPGGLLYGLPDYITNAYPIHTLIDQCIENPKEDNSRLQISDVLISVFQKIKDTEGFNISHYQNY